MISLLLAFVSIYMSVLFILIYLENEGCMDDPMPTRFPSVDVIVPAYNEEGHVPQALSSLLSLEYPGKKKIIFVNDGSTDGTLAAAKKFGGKGVLVLDKENGGKASALNLGLEHAGSELVAVLDADSIVAPDALLHMVGYFEDARVAAVTPMMKVRSSRTPAQLLQRGEYVANSFMKKILEQIDSITVTPGPFSVYRRKVFSELGGFDEGTVTEDQEIALRIQRAHHRIASSCGAVVYTDAPAGLRGLYAQRKRWYRGFLENAWRYRGLFHPSYGDLGMVVLPATLAMVAVGIFSLFYSAYSVLSAPFSLTPGFTPMFFGPTEFVLAFAALASFALVALAAGRLRENNPFSLFAACLVMSPILGAFWLMILIGAGKDLLTGVRMQWKGGA